MTANITAPASAFVIGHSFADARLSTPASRIQAAMSSMPPQASASDPNRVPDRPRSMMIRASMGKAVIASVTPTNAAVTQTWTPGMKIATWPSAARASPAPATSGTATPRPLIVDAVRPSPGLQVAAQLAPRLEHQGDEPELPGHVDDRQQRLREQVGLEPRC